MRHCVVRFKGGLSNEWLDSLCYFKSSKRDIRVDRWELDVLLSVKPPTYPTINADLHILGFVVDPNCEFIFITKSLAIWLRTF